MHVRSLPSHERLRELFDYHPDGHFIRRVAISTKSRVGDTVNYKPDGNGYRHCHVDGEMFYMHRLVFMWHHGYCPEFLDHRDQHRSNNRIGNLRPTDWSSNLHNGRTYRNSKTGIRNVSPHRDGGFQVVVSRDGKSHTAYAQDIDEAVTIRDRIRSDLGLQSIGG